MIVRRVDVLTSTTSGTSSHAAQYDAMRISSLASSRPTSISGIARRRSTSGGSARQKQSNRRRASRRSGPLRFASRRHRNGTMQVSYSLARSRPRGPPNSPVWSSCRGVRMRRNDACASGSSSITPVNMRGETYFTNAAPSSRSSCDGSMAKNVCRSVSSMTVKLSSACRICTSGLCANTSASSRRAGIGTLYFWRIDWATAASALCASASASSVTTRCITLCSSLPNAATSCTCGTTTFASCACSVPSCAPSSTTSPRPAKAGVPSSSIDRQKSIPPRRQLPSDVTTTDAGAMLLCSMWHVVCRKSSARSTLCRPMSVSCTVSVAGAGCAARRCASVSSMRSVTTASIAPSSVTSW
eukprot:Unigene12058_Nuclearia_a/m.36676 Unigene12058_Nuclearia_a/g.36676  ORF Unigene12058_Nuclearia_a/g.36676 Unigene12058_Nuclearia_a/m.36676 type:complete len:357 (-) Unigene12058_Nuclearia_a:274-1344(-)